MSDYNRGYSRSIPAQADMSVDAGLRSFMLGVYNKMALGLLLSGALAWLTGTYEPVSNLLFARTASGAFAGYTVIGLVVAFAPLVILLGSAFLMKSVTPRNSGILYWTIVTLIGASLGVVFMRYQLGSVASTFFVTATAFGALSLYGYTTKRDLGPIGSFLIMGVWGLILASLVGMFFSLPGLSIIISALGVLIFAGLTAYDTQRLKLSYYELGGNTEALGVATNYGALSLYLDFINLFQFLLQFMGQRR